MVNTIKPNLYTPPELYAEPATDNTKIVKRILGLVARGVHSRTDNYYENMQLTAETADLISYVYTMLGYEAWVMPLAAQNIFCVSGIQKSLYEIYQNGAIEHNFVKFICAFIEKDPEFFWFNECMRGKKLDLYSWRYLENHANACGYTVKYETKYLGPGIDETLEIYGAYPK